MTSDVGADHCRVTEAGAGQSVESALEYHRHLFAYAEAARQLPPGARVLEVGSGGGYGANFLASRGFAVTAVEPSAQAVAYCRERFPTVQFLVASGTGLPFEERFDAVVSFQVIEHVAEVARYLLEMRRVLVPGGRIFVTTPNRQLRLFPLQRPWNPYHLREYSARSLRREIAPSFPTVEVNGVYARGPVMRLEIERVRRMKLGRAGAALERLPGMSLMKRLQRIIQPPPESVAQSDFFVAARTHGCMDLFVKARK